MSAESKRNWRIKNPEKAREANRLSNARRVRIGKAYFGMTGFTEKEKEMMLNGKAQ